MDFINLKIHERNVEELVKVIEDLSKEEYGMSGTVHSKLFDKNLEVWIEEDVSIEYVNLCAKSLNCMGDNLIEDICKAAISYSEKFCEMIGQEPPKIEKMRDILQYVEFGSMHIDEPEDVGVPVVHLTGGCEWEQEHGIEVIVRNGELIYLGAYNGEWAWGEVKHYEEDYNYAYVVKQSVNIGKESLD